LEEKVKSVSIGGGESLKFRGGNFFLTLILLRKFPDLGICQGHFSRSTKGAVCEEGLSPSQSRSQFLKG
jgi:hypothetical protein